LHRFRATQFLGVLYLLPCFAGCSGGGSSAPAPPPPFAATVSLNANLSGSEPPSAYPAEYQAIRALGARGAQTAAPWAALNPTGTTYDLTMLSNPYFGTAVLAAQGFTSILLNLPIVTIGVRSMPADLAALPFDDPAVRSRYRALLDQVMPLLGPEVDYVAFGNEVDTYLSAHPSEWAAYWTLIDDAKVHLQTLRPDVRVGVTTTFDGAVGASSANVMALHAAMDVVVLTYYPVAANGFAARPSTTVAPDLAAMVALAAGKPLVLQECGCPSSAVLQSSPLQQADFVAAVFTEWRRYGSDAIPFVSFFKLRDWNAAHCTAISGGQTVGQPFFEFLCSLGLQQNDGTPKPALAALLAGIATIDP
jgi:hypothetical protein